MTKIISINNKKGGTGKTTVSINLAVHLSNFGRVLFIDTDESGNATRRFSQELDEYSKTSNIFRNK
ncbi:MAG: ParA family protein, partial [Streptococcaceae bacterium]|nr:ParA family protein [Streptococcaceae bacterium]